MRSFLAIMFCLLAYGALGIPLPWWNPDPTTNSAVESGTNEMTLSWCQPSNTVAHLYMTDDLGKGFGTNYLCISEPTNLLLPNHSMFFKVAIATN